MELKRPDSRVRISWSVLLLITALIPAALSVMLLRLSFVPSWLGWGFTALWGLVLIGLLTLWVPLRYRHARYGIGEEELCVVSGVYTVARRYMPLTAVRHITVIRGPLERLFGLSFVWVAAAGGWLLLEGLPADEAEELCRRWMRR